MPRLQKRKKTKKPPVVHFFRIKGLWSHFFIMCGFVMLVWIILSPFADTNPSWKQPNEIPLTHPSLEKMHGISTLPKRFIEITLHQQNPKTFLVNGETNPSLYLRPGQTVRMIFQNSSIDGIYSMTIPSQKLYVLSYYGKIPENVIEEESLSILPGKQVEVFFTPTWYGVYPVQAYYHTTGISRNERITLMEIKVQGLPMLPSPLPIKLTQ